MHYKILFSLLFALHLIATGLLRCIEAQAYKPKALWFCVASAAILVLGALITQLKSRLYGHIIIGGITLLVLVFYSYSFLSAPEQDANLRIGAIILSSIAQLMVVFFPLQKRPI